MIRPSPLLAALISPLLPLLLLLTSPAAASAQITGSGVRAGLNVATLDTSDETGSAPVESQLRSVVAGYLTWRMLSWLELQPEVAYTLKGGKTDDALSTKALLDYIELPLLGRVSTGQAGSRRFYGAAGAAVAVLLRARTRANFGDATEEIDIRDDVESLDWGMVVAGGLELRSLVFDARYTHGLRDVDRDRTDSTQVYNRVLSFTAGIRF